MRNGRQDKGFSLLEVVLALGLLAVTMLAMGLLSLTIVRSTTESSDRVSAATVASTLLDRLSAQAQLDPLFWNTDYTTTPYAASSYEAGGIDYEYEMFAQTLVDSTGDPIGEGLDKNTVKSVTIVLTWFDTKSQDKAGYGKLKFTSTRILNELGKTP